MPRSLRFLSRSRSKGQHQWGWDYPACAGVLPTLLVAVRNCPSIAPSLPHHQACRRMYTTFTPSSPPTILSSMQIWMPAECVFVPPLGHHMEASWLRRVHPKTFPNNVFPTSNSILVLVCPICRLFRGLQAQSTRTRRPESGEESRPDHVPIS